MSNIKYTPKPSSTRFNADGKEVLKITADGFFVQGVKIDDPYDVYNRFNAWLAHVEKKENLEE